jgi:hypothetical protein
MDLPICPACGQSVLEDDAVDCPFCGAPMKGGAAKGGKAAPAKKPTAAPAPAAGAKPAAATSTSGAHSTAKPASSAAKSTAATKGKAAADDENLIEPDASLQAQSIPVVPEKSEKKSFEVTCPFCKSVGYVSPRHAGMHVKCHNPKCLVPIFKAPEIKKEEAPAPPPARKKSKLPLIAVGVVLIGAIAGGIWWAMQPPKEVVVEQGQLYKPTGTGDDDAKKLITDAEERKRKKEEDARKASSATLAPDELIRTAAGNIVELAQRTATTNSKQSSRRMAAIALITAGDVKRAQEQIDWFQSVDAGKKVPEYQITPLVALAWHHLASGNAAEAGKALDAAATLVAKLPSQSRFTALAALELATAQVAADRTDAARELVSKFPFRNSLGQLTANLHVGRHAASFNADAKLPGHVVGDWQNPSWVAVTLAATHHGRWSQALKFASEIKDEEIKSECIAVWSEAWASEALRAKKPDDVAKAREAGAGLTPAGQVRVLARVAAVQIDNGDRSGGEASLKLAEEKLNSISVPPPVKLGDLKDILNLNLPDPVPLRLALLAAAETAALQDRLGQPDAAWSSLQKSLAFARAMAPSPVATELRTSENENRVDLVKQELKAVRELRSDDDVRRAFNRFKQQCADLQQAAYGRFVLQVQVLRAATQWGIRDRLWDEFQILTAKQDPNEREPYITTPLPQRLVFQLAQSGKADSAREISDRFSQLKVPTDSYLDLEQTTTTLMASGDVDGAAAMLNNFTGDKHRRDLWAVRLACRQVLDGHVEAALKLSLSISDDLFVDDAVRCTAAFGAVNGHAEALWKFAHERPPSSERSALQLGLVEGLFARLRAKPKEVTAK